MEPLPSPPWRNRALIALLVTTLVSPGLSATDAPIKDHSIFVGLDVSVARKGKYYRIVGAQKNAVQIMVNRQLTSVPLADARDLRLDRGVKLGNLSASITNLQGSKGASQLQATAETDMMSSAMFVQDMREDQRDKVLGEALWAGVLGQRTDGTRSAPNLAQSVSEKAMAQLPDLTRSINQSAQMGNDMVTGRPGPEGGLSDTGFVVSFEVTAPATLEQCHVAVVADYTLAGDSALPLSSVSVEPIGTLGPAARKISCEVRRFPPGAELQGYRLALYSRGQEVVTNLSSRRTDITRDEAVLFLTMDYVTKHPDETRPPTPVLMVSRAEFVSRLGSAPLDQIIYARVGTSGKIIQLSSDPSGVTRLPAVLASAIEPVAFVPALEKGRPVEGLARLKLADLVASN